MLAATLPATLVDLANYSIAPFDYKFENSDDDFLPLMADVLSYDRVILATPVYWYSPSATMKKFMDRLSDLLKIRKDLGRQLRNKRAALLATGSDATPAACFEECFKRTYQYLGMSYEGLLYASCDDGFDAAEYRTAILRFVDTLNAHRVATT
jgi:multimeric flavodoxin WrbA